MGDTSETNTKVLSRELFLGVVALKRLYRKIFICATRTLFSGTVTFSISLVIFKCLLLVLVIIKPFLLVLVSFSYFQTLVLVSRAGPFTDSSAMSR